jgi:hypothetical protein
MSKRVLNPSSFKVRGSYSPAWEVSSGRVIFVAGQVPWNAEGRTVCQGDVAGQTRQVFENIRVILAEAGATLDDVVKLTSSPPTSATGMRSTRFAARPSSCPIRPARRWRWRRWSIPNGWWRSRPWRSSTPDDRDRFSFAGSGRDNPDCAAPYPGYACFVRRPAA